MSSNGAVAQYAYDGVGRDRAEYSQSIAAAPWPFVRGRRSDAASPVTAAREVGGRTSASLIGYGSQAPFSAWLLSRPMRVTLLSVVGVLPALPQALVGSGRGASLWNALDAQQTSTALPRLPRPHRTNCNESCSFSGDHFVRRAPPSLRCSTWSRRSTWCGAPRRACGRPLPAHVAVP